MILILKQIILLYFRRPLELFGNGGCSYPEGHSLGLGQTEQKGEFEEHDDNSHKAASLGQN